MQWLIFYFINYCGNSICAFFIRTCIYLFVVMVDFDWTWKILLGFFVFFANRYNWNTIWLFCSILSICLCYLRSFKFRNSLVIFICCGIIIQVSEICNLFILKLFLQRTVSDSLVAGREEPTTYRPTCISSRCLQTADGPVKGQTKMVNYRCGIYVSQLLTLRIVPYVCRVNDSTGHSWGDNLSERTVIFFFFRT